MKPRLSDLLIFLLILSLNFSLEGQTKIEKQWPGYRGYMSSGILDNAKLPETFDPSTMKNIKWKIEIPGLGISSPVIWDNYLFITTAVSKSDSAGFNPGSQIGVVSVNDSSVHQWKVLCLDKNNGKRKFKLIRLENVNTSQSLIFRSWSGMKAISSLN